MPNLGELLIEAQNISKAYREGKLNLLDKDFKDIFVQLKKLISPNYMPESLLVMKEGTQILEHKIEEFEKFLSFLNKREEIIKFLEDNPKERTLSTILINSFCNPVKLPKFSINFLLESYEKLIINKKITKKREDFAIPKDYSLEEIDLSADVHDPFKEQMVEYYNQILSKLPLSLENLLQDAKDAEEYYEKFTFLLHLIQRDYLLYDSNQGTIILNENKKKNNN